MDSPSISTFCASTAAFTLPTSVFSFTLGYIHRLELSSSEPHNPPPGVAGLVGVSPDSVQLKSRDKGPWLFSTGRTSSAEDSPSTPATSATEAAPRNALRRWDRAAFSGVSGAGSVPDSTGVSPSGACRAILLPAIADAMLVRSAPPRRMFLRPAREASRSLSASLRPPSLHMATVAHREDADRLEARPGFVEDAPALTLIADAFHGGVQGHEPEERPAQVDSQPHLVQRADERRCLPHSAASFHWVDNLDSPA